MIIKKSNKNKNGYSIKISKKDWLNIGKRAGWIKSIVKKSIYDPSIPDPADSGVERGDFHVDEELSNYINVDYFLKEDVFWEEARKSLENIRKNEIGYFINEFDENDYSSEVFDETDEMWKQLAPGFREKFRNRNYKDLYEALLPIKEKFNNIEDYVDISEFPFEDPGDDREPPDFYDLPPRY